MKQQGTVNKAIAEENADAISMGSEDNAADRQKLSTYINSAAYEKLLIVLLICRKIKITTRESLKRKQKKNLKNTKTLCQMYIHS